jgi:hypothetical protein
MEVSMNLPAEEQRAIHTDPYLYLGYMACEKGSNMLLFFKRYPFKKKKINKIRLGKLGWVLVCV